MALNFQNNTLENLSLALIHCMMREILCFEYNLDWTGNGASGLVDFSQ